MQALFELRDTTEGEVRLCKAFAQPQGVSALIQHRIDEDLELGEGAFCP
jgi:hypothetical protein